MHVYKYINGEKVGRHTEYTEEIGLKICRAVATSTKSLKEICEENKFPTPKCINEWRIENINFGLKYAQAKAQQAELLAEEIVEIAKSCKENSYYIDEKGQRKVDPGAVQADRLVIDTQKWVACKLAPRIYGERKPEQDGAEEHKLVIELKHD